MRSHGEEAYATILLRLVHGEHYQYPNWRMVDAGSCCPVALAGNYRSLYSPLAGFAERQHGS
jgi:hypothetical protein